MPAKSKDKPKKRVWKTDVKYTKQKEMKGKIKFAMKNKRTKLGGRVRADGVVWEQKLGFGNTCDDNATPPAFYKVLNKEFKFNFDPCPLGGKKYMDGLSIPWKKSNYVNPPFSEVKKWAAKAYEETKRGNKTVILAPLRTTSKYWQKFIIPFASEIRFLANTLSFGKHDKPLPIPLVLIIYKPRSKPGFKLVDKGEYMYIAPNKK